MKKSKPLPNLSIAAPFSVWQMIVGYNELKSTRKKK